MSSPVVEEWRSESVGTGGRELPGVNGVAADRLNELSCFTTFTGTRDARRKSVGKNQGHRNAAFEWKCSPSKPTPSGLKVMRYLSGIKRSPVEYVLLLYNTIHDLCVSCVGPVHCSVCVRPLQP